MSEVMAIGPWKNNAEMIADMPRLGYLDWDWNTLDATYGKGKFWTKFRPWDMVTNDLDPASPAGWHYDFTAFPDDWASGFSAVVFDPPYKLNGTSTGKGSSAMDAGYGVGGPYVKWQDRHALIKAGIVECVRVLKPKGHLLIKCQDQVCSGQVRWQTFEFTATAVVEGCRLVDMLHLVGGRKQPDRGQQHARRNYSSLLVCRKG